MKTFQDLIQNLTQFWVKKGCIYEQGHDLEAGAGTFNPATFLRCLGPEPYSTVYVEPSRRPQDGRYGENPNRLQLFHQLQVIIKPSPLDIQNLYLESLQQAGFDLSRHDIRFVHDDWESPTLGAWGLGWEVWIDGMEVTQFTYFQSVAGHSLSPISVEITYGLERLGMILQDIDNVFDMQWNDVYTYGDIKHRNEFEWSHHNFHLASTEMWLRHFEDFEKEAERLATQKYPIPAYDFVLKASHAFNILEARGILSTTERALYIAKIRHLSTLVANSYLENREELGFPLLSKQQKEAPKEAKLEPIPEIPPLKKENFLLEIGSEELPATFVPIGMRNLESDVRELLKKHKLEFSNIHSYGTPRRISIVVESLISSSKEELIERRGPGTATAFDASGALTKQGAGFFRSLGIESITLEKVQSSDEFEIKDGYIFAKILKKGKSSLKILSEELPKLIENLSFPKSMKWADYSIQYARPLKWIVSLFGKHLIPLQVGPIYSDRLSFGHSQLSPDKFPIKEAKDYLSTLRKHFVIADTGERKRAIIEQLLSIENDTASKALETNKVLKEVLHLSEWPLLTAGSFSQTFLKCPKEVLVSEMVCHQKYFPLESDGKLINQFVITADNTPSEEIIKGNEKVLSARLSDGVFLYEQDLAISLDTFNETLKNVIFQKELGSYYDKVIRMESLISQLSSSLQLSNKEDVKKAAHYSKSDLASNLVDEFPDLQGVIGKYYAIHHGLSEEIALGIEEHWMPKSEGAELPSSPIGILLSLTDKLDNLISYFSVGLKPTSSSDPHALRRQTIGIIKILIANKLSIDLSALIASDDVLDYLTTRAKGVFEEFGFKKDEIEASLKGKCINPYEQYCMTKSMHEFRATKDFTALHEVYKRAKGQVQDAKSDRINETLLEDSSEKNLYLTLKELEPKIKKALADKNYSEAFTLLSSLKSPLGTLYDSVKILADDEKVRNNRLALLKNVFTNFNRLLDFSKIQ